MVRVTEPLFLFTKLSKLPLSLGLQSLHLYPCAPYHTDDSRQGWQTLLETSWAQAFTLMRHGQAECSYCARASHGAKEDLFLVSSVWVRTREHAGCPGVLGKLPSLSQCSQGTVQCLQKQGEPSLHWEAQEAKAGSKVPHSEGGPSPWREQGCTARP